MTVHAGRPKSSALLRFSVKTPLPCRLFIRVTVRAGNFGGSIFVRRTCYIDMAIHTREHLTMHRVLEFFGVNVKAYRFAIRIFVEACICVAGKADESLNKDSN